MSLVTSTRNPADAVYRHVIPAGEPWLFEIKAGQTLRLHDLEGNQAIDTLFYCADSPRERYDAQRTLRRQNNAYLTHGSVLYSNLGNPLLTIVADTCGRHDTLGGACAQESNGPSRRAPAGTPDRRPEAWPQALPCPASTSIASASVRRTWAASRR